MSLILCPTTSTNEDYNADCDFAVVDVTPELVESVRRRMALAIPLVTQDDSLYELRFWDYTPDFYSYGEWSNGLDVNDEWSPLTREIPQDDEEVGPHGYECGQMVVALGKSAEPRVYWTVIPKHTSLHVSTPSITLQELEALLG